MVVNKAREACRHIDNTVSLLYVLYFVLQTLPLFIYFICNMIVGVQWCIREIAGSKKVFIILYSLTITARNLHDII